MNDNPSRGQAVDITLHQVLLDDVKPDRDEDDLGWVASNDLSGKTTTYTLTVNGTSIPDVRGFHVQLHDPSLTGPEDVDPRTEVMEHWGRDPELIIGAWHADRSGLQHLAKHHEERANGLAADLDNAERENRRLTVTATPQGLDQWSTESRVSCGCCVELRHAACGHEQTIDGGGVADILKAIRGHECTPKEAL